MARSEDADAQQLGSQPSGVNVWTNAEAKADPTNYQGIRKGVGIVQIR